MRERPAVRVLRWGAAIAVVAVLTMCTQTPAAPDKPSEPQPIATPEELGIHCEKDFYVFVDISLTMLQKDEQSGKIPLVEFADATKRVLNGLVGKSDHVVLYAFSHDVYTLASTHPDISGSSDYIGRLDSLSNTNAASLLKNVHTIIKNDDLQLTDFRRVFDKLLEVSRGDTQKYFVVASDFYHDRDNWRCAPTGISEASIASDLQYMRGKMDTIKAHTGGLKAHLVPLAHHSPCAQAENKTARDLANDVIAKFGIAFTLPATTTVDALNTPADDIRDAFAKNPAPTVIGGPAKSDKIPFSVLNRNPFPIRLKGADLIDAQKQTQVLDTVQFDKEIGCGETYPFELSTKNGKTTKSVLARATYDIGTPADSEKPILIDSVDFSSVQATYIPAVLGAGTLVLDVAFRDHLRDTTTLVITIGSTTERFKIKPNAGVSQRLALPFEVKESDRENAESTNIPVKISVENGRFSRDGVEPKDNETPATQTSWSPARMLGRLLALLSNIGGTIGLILAIMGRESSSRLKRVLLLAVSVLVIASNFLPLDVHTALNGGLQIALFWATVSAISSALGTWGMLLLFIWGRFWETELASADEAAALRRRGWRWIAYAATLGGIAALFAHPFPFLVAVGHSL